MKDTLGGFGAEQIRVYIRRNCLAEYKRAAWRLQHGVAECEWRGRIGSLRAASVGPPGKR